MDEIRFQIFAYIVSRVETPLVAAVNGVVTAFLAFAAQPLRVALVLFIALTGLTLARGATGEPASLIVGRLLKASLVVWLLTGSGAYQQWVYNFFFVALPQGLSGALTSGGVTAVSANSFDQVWVRSWRAGLEVWNSAGWMDFGKQFAVLLFWVAAILSTVFCFAIWLISRVVLALYVALGPLLVGLVLFPATRAVFERWIGSLIACVILQVTTVVLLFIILQVIQQVVGAIGAMPRGESMSMIQVLLAGMIFFGVAAFVALQLPGVASSLAGGLAFHTGAVVRAMGSAGSAGTRAAGRTLAGAGRAGLATGRFVAGRLRPPPGGSLSDGGGGGGAGS